MKHNGLTTTQFADLLVISSQTVINWIKAGKLKCRRIGKGPRIISYDEAMKFIENNVLDKNTLNQKMYNNLLLIPRAVVSTIIDPISNSSVSALIPTEMVDSVSKPSVSALVPSTSLLTSILANVNGEQKSVPIENPQVIKTGYIRIQINQDFTKAKIV